MGPAPHLCLIFVGSKLNISLLLSQFPILALVAVLATGGIDEENKLHNLLYVASAVPILTRFGGNINANADWRVWTLDWSPQLAAAYIQDVGGTHHLKRFR